jgi:hypothetical protein
LGDVAVAVLVELQEEVQGADGYSCGALLVKHLGEVGSPSSGVWGSPRRST